MIMYSGFYCFVTGGRRCDGNITLAHILRFVTGRETEPVLGFAMNPTIVFKEGLFPANTCICQLQLPHVTETNKLKAFEKFDLAFANAYFGYA